MEWEVQIMATNKPEKKTKTKLIGSDANKTIPYAIVEAYKSLRVQLTSILKKKNINVIAVSSPNASEGKSTTSVNIAIMLSQLNKKVVLVDTDARRASIHQKLKIDNDLGCLDVLSNNAELEQVIKNYNPYLDIITSGKSASNSSELFDSPEFDRMLSELKNKYDYVIVDTPPINLVSDALVVSQKCDGLLLIVRSTITTYEAFNQTKMSVDHLNINLLGVILNGVGANTGKYYRYKKYYGYNRYHKYYKYSNSYHKY